MVGLLLIATRKYKSFIKPLLEQVDRFFLPKENLTVFLFTDEEFLYNEADYDFVVKQFRIEPLQFPFATLYRYRLFMNQFDELIKCSHLYYLDVDMKIVSTIGNEVLVDGLLAVRHPGTYGTDRWGSPNTSPESTAYFPLQYRKHYYCGGVQGGYAPMYLKACEEMATNIETDEKRGVMAEWHDETHWNKILSEQYHLVTELSPAYCMPESKEHQMSWGLSEFEPKIIALDKNHAEIRS